LPWEQPARYSWAEVTSRKNKVCEWYVRNFEKFNEGHLIYVNTIRARRAQSWRGAAAGLQQHTLHEVPLKWREKENMNVSTHKQIDNRHVDNESTVRRLLTNPTMRRKWRPWGRL